MTPNNTGGWMLTTLTYALGGRMRVRGRHRRPTVDNDATGRGSADAARHALADESMGKNTNFEWGTINEAFAAGKVGMYMSGSDVYNALVHDQPGRPGLLRAGRRFRSPTAREAGILGGGSVAAVSAKATPDEAEAAVAWNDFYREKKNYDPDAAVADAEVLKASDQPIGTPTLPIFDEATWQARAGRGSSPSSTSRATR